MKMFLIAAGFCALFATPGLAGEPAKLTSAQMDKVSAGKICVVCLNIASVEQVNLNESFFSAVRQRNRASIHQSIN